MKPLHIFRAGRHTASCGTTLSFDESALQASVAAYDPALHEAPIVVGHPRDNGPAFGWIKGLSFSDGNLHAEPHQVNPDFEALVEQGAYKKISASFYSPEAPANPAPGTWYLRHVGFLGAQPPAIKGLQAIGFAEDEPGVVSVDFSDYATATIARNLREWLLGRFGKEAADEVVPSHLVADIEDAARAPLPEAAAPGRGTTASPLFSETEDHPMTMTPEQIAAAQAELAARQTDIDAREAAFSERETRIAATERAIALADITSQVDALIATGKVLPSEKARLISFMAARDGDRAVEFSEDGQPRSQSAKAVLLGILEALPRRVDFSERAPGATAANDDAPRQLAARATAYREAQAKAGIAVSFTEAVNAVSQV